MTSVLPSRRRIFAARWTESNYWEQQNVPLSIGQLAEHRDVILLPDGVIVFLGVGS